MCGAAVMNTFVEIAKAFLPSLFTRKEYFTGRDFNGRDVTVKIAAPENDGPGYYEVEWLQDCGGGVMFCGKVIRADSFRDAVLNGPYYIRAKGAACNYAYGNLPERVRRLPDNLQDMPIKDAENAWKLHSEYHRDPSDSERINPWRLGPVISGRSGI